MDKARTIIHIDMDAFFASVEERDNPSLRGKPLGVIGSNARTVLVTASYQARKFGVKTGMNVPEAKRACPNIILVKADHRKYTAVCSQVVRLLDDFSPLVEIFSIDEFFVDTAGLSGIFGTPLEMAKNIKKKIKEETGLNASIGIAPNKLLAKLASDLAKPNGIKYIEHNKVEETLKNLPVQELCGIGRKTRELLNSMNIHTCGDLIKMDNLFLIKKLGKAGERLYYMSRGEDSSPVVPFRNEAKEKSMGHSMTFPKDIKKKDELLRQILRLSDMVGIRLRQRSMAGETISITIRYKSFKTFSKQKKISLPTNNTKTIFDTASQILDTLKLKEPVRLAGVTVSNLKESFPVMSLFKEDEKCNKLDSARDAINNIFGSDTIQFASVLRLKKHNKVISPSWRPDGARKY